MGVRKDERRIEAVAGELAIVSHSVNQLSDQELDTMLGRKLYKKEKAWVLAAARRILARMTRR